MSTRPPPQECHQVLQVGPYSGGFTARISKINPRTGARSTLVDHLPSSQTTPATGGFVSGVADMAFIDDTLYALEGALAVRMACKAPSTASCASTAMGGRPR